MNIIYTYSLYEPYLQNSKYWINCFIKKGADDYNFGLYGACLGGHLDIINMMLQKGADVNYGLYGACLGGHLDLVNMMLQKGADVNWGLQGACLGGHLDLIKLMLEIGAKPQKNIKYHLKFLKMTQSSI